MKSAFLSRIGLQESVAEKVSIFDGEIFMIIDTSIMKRYNLAVRYVFGCSLQACKVESGKRRITFCTEAQKCESFLLTENMSG